jgi:cysteine desulfurase
VLLHLNLVPICAKLTFFKCAAGADDEMAHSSLRFGIGRFTTEREIELAVDLLEKHVHRLREMSPLWEMVQDGIDLKSIEWTQDSSHHH